jgi:hypothetical protein
MCGQRHGSTFGRLCSATLPWADGDRGIGSVLVAQAWATGGDGMKPSRSSSCTSGPSLPNRCSFVHLLYFFLKLPKENFTRGQHCFGGGGGGGRWTSPCRAQRGGWSASEPTGHTTGVYFWNPGRQARRRTGRGLGRRGDGGWVLFLQTDRGCLWAGWNGTIEGRVVWFLVDVIRGWVLWPIQMLLLLLCQRVGPGGDKMPTVAAATVVASTIHSTADKILCCVGGQKHGRGGQ